MGVIRLIKLFYILLVVFAWTGPMSADTNMKQGEDLLKPETLRARPVMGQVITADLDSVSIYISSSTQGIGIGSLVKVFTSMSSNGLAAMAGFWEVEKIMGPHLVAVPLDMRVMPEAFGSAIVYPLEHSELLTRVALDYAKSGDRYYADKKYDKAAKAYTLASKMGHANSMVRLGIMYTLGLHYSKDKETAVFWYEKAATLNHPPGIYHLGLMMSKGEGIKKDLPRARTLFAKSAVMDHPQSQFNLGVLYYNGLGGKKDDAKALEWFEKAADMGDSRAEKKLTAQAETYPTPLL